MTRPTFELEFADPHVGQPCPCCGGLSVRSTGFVTVDGGAYAVYYTAYANNHPDQELALIVSIGDWSEDADETKREAFYCRLRPGDESYALMLGDASDSPWADVDLLGRKLSREQAQAHPLKETLFALTDEIGARDPRVVGYFARAECGDTGIPLERRFAMPDEIWALAEQERDERTQLGRNFATLDDHRHFVRAMLGFDVEHYGDWSVGLWVANDLEPMELPAPLGTEVTVGATDPEHALRVKDSAHVQLRELRAKAWDRAGFETYAVAAGLL